MEQNQAAGASAPSDDAFMAELLGDAGPGPQQPETQQQPDNRSDPQAPAAREDRVPINVLLDERDKRQAAERRIAEFEAAEKKRSEEANGPQSGNFWEKPEDFLQSQERRLMTSFEQREQALRQDFQRQRVDMDERIVRMTHPDAFEPAQAWFVEQAKANPALAQTFFQQPSPCGWMIEQFQKSKVLGEVGSDPQAYRQKLLDEALKDPAFLARATEAARAGGFGGQPRSETGQFASKPTQSQRPTLPSMRAAGSPGVVTTRPSVDQSGDDLLDEVFSAT